MNLRSDLLKKLKSHEVDVSVNQLDEYYWKFISETNYEFSKFDGFLDLIENEDFFSKFLFRIKVYINESIE